MGHGHDFLHEEEEEDEHIQSALEDANYSMFDMNVDSIEVTLSLARWFEGKGLVEDIVVRGVRGILGTWGNAPFDDYSELLLLTLDRRNVTYDPDSPPIPADFRHQSLPGDFQLESAKFEDVLVTVYQPSDFRPYTVSIFRADLNKLRKQWICLDFLQAENIVGQIDNCLFSLHRPQAIGRTVETDMKDVPWARMVSFMRFQTRVVSIS